MKSLDLFVGLKNFLQGKITSDELEKKSPIIDDVIVDKTNLRNSKIKIRIDEDEFFKILGMSDDDIWIYNSVNNPHYPEEWYNYEDSKHEFRSGYGLWDTLDDENWDKLKTISNFIMTEPLTFSTDVDYLDKYSEKLLSLFPQEIGEMISVYQTEMNNVIINTAAEIFENELVEVYTENKIDYGGGILTMTAGEIYDLFLEEGLPYLTIKELLKLYLGGLRVGGWNTNLYEYNDPTKLDKSYLNKIYENELDKISSKIEIDSEGAKRYLEMIDRISKKFQQDEWYNLPKDLSGKYKFKIKNFTFDENLVVIFLKNENKVKLFKMTEQNFYNLLYQPELFNFDELYNL